MVDSIIVFAGSGISPIADRRSSRKEYSFADARCVERRGIGTIPTHAGYRVRAAHQAVGLWRRLHGKVGISNRCSRSTPYRRRRRSLRFSSAHWHRNGRIVLGEILTSASYLRLSDSSSARWVPCGVSVEQRRMVETAPVGPHALPLHHDSVALPRRSAARRGPRDASELTFHRRWRRLS